MGEAKRPRADGAATAGILVGGLLLLVLLYFASIGPMIWLCDSRHARHRCGSVEPALRVFYAPIIWLHEETPLEGVVDWYVDLWGG